MKFLLIQFFFLMESRQAPCQRNNVALLINHSAFTSLHSSLFPPDLSLCSINFTLFLPPLLFSNEHILSLIFPVSHCSYCSSRLLKLSTRLSVSFNTKGKVVLRRTRDLHLYPLPDCSCQPQSEALVQRGCLQQKQDAVFIFKFW